MDWFARLFLKSSLAWFGVGVTVGLLMVADPRLAAYRTAHFHMNLLGFVAMMIFGVAYHVVPRFTGNALHNPKLAGIHWWASNAGLLLLVSGFTLRVAGAPGSAVALAVGGALSALGAYLFIYNLWRTLDADRVVAREGLSRVAHVGPSRPIVIHSRPRA